MPANLQTAVSVGVLPQSLCTSFVFSGVYPLLRQSYHDSTIEQGLVTDCETYGTPVNAPRMLRSWKLAKRLTNAQLSTLRTFFFTTCTGGLQAFKFYDPFQPLAGHPIGSNYDATGSSSQGRVLVRFNGNWQEQTYLQRSVVPNLELAEVL